MGKAGAYPSETPFRCSTFRVIRMTIVSDATTWSITYDRHSDNSRGIIYNGKIFIIQTTAFVIKIKLAWKCFQEQNTLAYRSPGQITGLKSFTTFVQLRFLVGFNIGCVPQSVTLFAEFLPTKQRAKCVVLLVTKFYFGN